MAFSQQTSLAFFSALLNSFRTSFPGDHERSRLQYNGDFQAHRPLYGRGQLAALGRLAPLSGSHAWSEQRFPLGGSFLESAGRQALMAVNEQKCAGAVAYCWVDTICIDQQDDEDMNQQIPVMGRIFTGAVPVAVILSCDHK